MQENIYFRTPSLKIHSSKTKFRFIFALEIYRPFSNSITNLCRVPRILLRKLTTLALASKKIIPTGLSALARLPRFSPYRIDDHAYIYFLRASSHLPTRVCIRAFLSLSSSFVTLAPTVFLLRIYILIRLLELDGNLLTSIFACTRSTQLKGRTRPRRRRRRRRRVV